MQELKKKTGTVGSKCLKNGIGVVQLFYLIGISSIISADTCCTRQLKLFRSPAPI